MNKRATMGSRILQFFKTGIWEIRIRELPPQKAFAVKYLRIILLASRGFMRDNGQNTASMLTYYSLLNIVPIIAVAFAIAKGFGLDTLIGKAILQFATQAGWPTNITHQIINFSNNVLEKAKGGLIAGIGVVLLIWTVISILGKIEASLNAIWEVTRPRSLARKFSDYIAMMVLAPVLFIISSSATVLVTSQVAGVVKKISFLGVFSQLIFVLLNFLPYVSIWVLFTALYLIMPNTRIPLRSAILGGIIGGTIAEVVQWIYIKFQIGVASYGAIYGSFAALPLFLAMLQTSWMILLFGAEIAYASEHYETFGFYPDYNRISFSSKKILMLRVFHLITKKFSMAEKPLSVREISHSLDIPMRLVRQILYELTEVGLVVQTVRGEKSEPGFQPGRAIENITVKVALDDYEKYGAIKTPKFESEEADRILKYLEEISESVEKSPSNIRLKDI